MVEEEKDTICRKHSYGCNYNLHNNVQMGCFGYTAGKRVQFLSYTGCIHNLYPYRILSFYNCRRGERKKGRKRQAEQINILRHSFLKFSGAEDFYALRAQQRAIIKGARKNPRSFLRHLLSFRATSRNPRLIFCFTDRFLHFGASRLRSK